MHIRKRLKRTVRVLNWNVYTFKIATVDSRYAVIAWKVQCKFFLHINWYASWKKVSVTSQLNFSNKFSSSVADYMYIYMDESRGYLWYEYSEQDYSVQGDTKCSRFWL